MQKFCESLSLIFVYIFFCDFILNLFEKLAVDDSRPFAVKHAPQVRIDRPRPSEAAEEAQLKVAADLAD